MTVGVVGSGASEVAKRCGAVGVDEVVAVESASDEFDSHLAQRASEQLLDELEPSIVLAGQTVDSSGFAPALAAHNRLSFASNVLRVSWEAGRGKGNARCLRRPFGGPT